MLTFDQIHAAIRQLPLYDQVRILETVAHDVAVAQRPMPTAAIAAEFAALAKQWDTEMAYCSMSDELVAHPAYQKIIALGPAVIPLLLREMETKPDHWDDALITLTGANPMPPGAEGQMDVIAAAWVRWGKEQGYLP